MLILGLLGMYFDAAVVFVTKFSLLFRLALAILRLCMSYFMYQMYKLIEMTHLLKKSTT